MKTARGCRKKTDLGISESKLHLEFIILSWKRPKKNLSHGNFHSFIYRATKSWIYPRQWFLNCKLEQGTDIWNLSHCFALIKVVLNLLRPSHDTNTTIFIECFSETYIYFWFAPDDVKGMMMHNTKCKHKPVLNVNVNLDLKSKVRVFIFLRHSSPEIKLIIRRRINSIYIISKLYLYASLPKSPRSELL